MAIARTKFLKVTLILSSAILPILFILTFANIVDSGVINIISYLWVGFYSSIFLIKFVDIDWLEKILIILNAFVILTMLLGSLMGGIHGILLVILKMILPFIPAAWVGDLILYILP